MSSALSILPPGLDGGTSPRFVGVALTELVPEGPEELPEGAGISTHSSPWISNFFKKNGQSFTRRINDSVASAAEIGTGEDLITAVATSRIGRARRFRPGVALPLVGVENNLWTRKSTSDQRMN
jgi:hypothetical protein